MERRILYGNLRASDMAHALMAEFNRGNMQAQVLGRDGKLAVQITTRKDAQSGGQTALTINIQEVKDGVMIELGQQAWFGVAASIGATAISALRNPLSLLGRLDDIAQDIENIQLGEKIWNTIDSAAKALGASQELTERLTRITCGYCGSSNPLGISGCETCGAPLGDAHPVACPHCGFAISQTEKICPNCNNTL